MKIVSFSFQNLELSVNENEPPKKKAKRERVYSDLENVNYAGNIILYSEAKDEFIVPATLFRQLASKCFQTPNQSRQDIKQPINLQNEVELLRKYLWEKLGCPTLMKNIPIFDPKSMRKFCADAGAVNLFDEVINLITVPGQSRETKEKCAIRAVNLIHAMMYAQSQKCSWFQHAQASFLRKNGLSETGLVALWREGMAAHPRTARAMSSFPMNAL